MLELGATCLLLQYTQVGDNLPHETVVVARSIQDRLGGSGTGLEVKVAFEAASAAAKAEVNAGVKAKKAET